MSKKKIYGYSVFAIMLIIMMIGSTAIGGVVLWLPVSDTNIKYYLAWMICALLVLISFKASMDKITFILMVRAALLIINTFIHVGEYPDSWKINIVSQFFIPFLFYAACHIKMDREEIEKYILKFSRIMSTILAIQVIAQFLNSTVINGLDWNYVKSTVETPLGRTNYLAAFLIIYMICIDYLMESGFKKYIHIGLCALGIFCTMSDGSYVLTALYFVYRFIPYRRAIRKTKKKNFKSKIALVLVALVAIVLLVRFQNTIEGAYNHFLKDTVNATSVDQLLNGRTNVYAYSIGIIRDNPILGIGLGTVTGQTTRSHNIILQLLVSGGVVNLVIFLSVYFQIMRKNYVRKTDTFSRMVFTVMLFSLANSMYEVTFQSFQYDLLIFTLMGLSINLTSIKNKGNGYVQQKLS